MGDSEKDPTELSTTVNIFYTKNIDDVSISIASLFALLKFGHSSALNISKVIF